MIDTLTQFIAEWRDEPMCHKEVDEIFAAATYADPLLNEQRSWCRSNFIGFGEDSFSALWKLIVDTMPKDFSFLEIGVHRGQITSLIGALAKRTGRMAQVVGVSTFDGRELGLEGKTDFLADTWSTWGRWAMDDPNMPIPTGEEWGRHALVMNTICGDSTNKAVVAEAREMSPYNVVYIDGSHTLDNVRQDLRNYGAMVRSGGLLVIDDACCHLNLWSGAFPGIEAVSQATDEYLPPFTDNPDWLHVGSLHHLRIFRRV